MLRKPYTWEFISSTECETEAKTTETGAQQKVSEADVNKAPESKSQDHTSLT